jgi:hypothetical protein
MRFNSPTPIDGVIATYYPSTVTYLAGETLTKGQVVAIVGGKWSKATAASAGNADRMLGIALDDAVLNETVLVALAGATVAIPSVWSFTGSGQPLYVSPTAGSLTDVPPSGASQIVRIAGFVTGSSALLFQPESGHLVLV